MAVFGGREQMAEAAEKKPREFPALPYPAMGFPYLFGGSEGLEAALTAAEQDINWLEQFTAGAISLPA